MKDVIKTQQRPEEIKTINGQRVRLNRRKRRSNLKGYYALAMMFVALIVMLLCLTLFFRAGNIKISGVSLYREDQIIGVGGIEKGANLIRLNTSIIEQRILNNLVYIDEVKVEKKYPSTIVVTCKEAKKAADIKDGDSYYVMSSSGKILEAGNPKHTKGFPTVKGFKLKSKDVGSTIESEDSFKAKILRELLADLDELNFKKITKIDLTSRSDIRLYYDNRIEIELGSSADMNYKLNYFKSIIDKCLTKDYEGTLIYNGTDSGISAIPKENDSSSSTSDNDNSTVSESAVDSENSESQIDQNDESQNDQTAEQSTDSSTANTDEQNNGYSENNDVQQWNNDGNTNYDGVQ